MHGMRELYGPGIWESSQEHLSILDINHSNDVTNKEYFLSMLDNEALKEKLNLTHQQISQV